jgi:hypothetical protein
MSKSGTRAPNKMGGIRRALAELDRAFFQNFGGTPFPFQRLHDLAKRY